MDGLLTALLLMVIDIYMILFFLRIFTVERERYDSMLGLVFTATDPVLRAIRPYLPWRSGPATALVVVAALLLLKGILWRSIPMAVRGMTDTLLQLYVLIILITATVREYYINPLLTVAQRLVRPVYALATPLASQPLAVYVVSGGLLVLAHAILRLGLQQLGGGGGLPVAVASEPFLIPSLRLVVNLTAFFTYAIIINALLSWVSPDPLNPIVQLLTLLAAPIVDPVRRVVPPLGGVLDLSPLVAIVLLQLANNLLHSLLDAVQHSLA